MNIAKVQAIAPVHFDEKTIRQSLNQTPFLLEHRLVGHPLFELPRLIELAVTPYHIDHESNFLLQVVGMKTVRMLPPNDPTVIQEVDLERFYAGGSRNLLQLDSQTQTKASTFELTPGLAQGIPMVRDPTSRECMHPLTALFSFARLEFH